VTISTIRNIERGRTDRPYKLGDVLRALGIEEPNPIATSLSDDELIRETRRRAGDQAAEILRGYLEAERSARTADGRRPASSQSDNDTASA
jgi:hypothetical protein